MTEHVVGSRVMTEAERTAAALADPDARPMSEAEWARAKRVPQITTLRRRLGLSLEEFSERYRIPLETLQDWEAGRSAPDPVGQAAAPVQALPTLVQSSAPALTSAAIRSSLRFRKAPQRPSNRSAWPPAQAPIADRAKPKSSHCCP